MKHLLLTAKILLLLALLFIGKNSLAAPTVEAHIIHYTLPPKSGASFSHITQLSIVLLANKLSKEFRSPYTLVYRIIDKEGNVIDAQRDKILFNLCDDLMLPVKMLGTCGDYNNVATIKLKSRHSRRPPATNDYIKKGQFWIKKDEIENYPRFEEMEYKLDSFTLVDKSGKVVSQLQSN